jgi:cytidylate kinase
MKHNIITIGREFGSGGHEIGARLAARLGMKFYDKELVKAAAEKMGCCENFVENNNEKTPGVFARGVSFSRGATYAQLSPEDNIYVCQSLAIKEFAEEGNCIIVGRCADYILRERDDVVNIFVYASLEDRIERKMLLAGNDKSAAAVKKEIIATDKRREKYYNFYTGNRWGDSRNYHICIDTSKIGVDGAVDIIVDYIEKYSAKGILPD